MKVEKNSVVNFHYLNSTSVIINIMSIPRGIFNKTCKAHIIPFLNIDDLFLRRDISSLVYLALVLTIHSFCLIPARKVNNNVTQGSSGGIEWIFMRARDFPEDQGEHWPSYLEHFNSLIASAPTTTQYHLPCCH